MKILYFAGVMAEIGIFDTVMYALWYLTKLDIIEMIVFSITISIFLTFPIMMQIEELETNETKSKKSRNGKREVH